MILIPLCFSGRANSLESRRVLGGPLGGAAEIERLILYIALAEPSSDLRLGELGAQIEGVGSIRLDAEAGIKAQSLLSADTQGLVVGVDTVVADFDAEIVVPDGSRINGDLFGRADDRSLVVQSQQGVAVALGQGRVSPCCEHHPAGGVVFLDGTARMGAHLHQKDIAHREFGTSAKQQGRQAEAVGVGQLCEIASAHHHLRPGHAPAEFDEARE